MSNIRQAIIWPLTSDQTPFEPYYVSAEDDKFPAVFRQELQQHIAGTVSAIFFNDKRLADKAMEFIRYAPLDASEDDTIHVAQMFVQLSDKLAEHVDDNNQIAQWRIRLFSSPSRNRTTNVH